MRFLLTDKLYLKFFSALAIGIFLCDTIRFPILCFIPIVLLLFLQSMVYVFKINRPKLKENLFYVFLIYVGMFFHWMHFIVPKERAEKLLEHYTHTSHPFLVRIDHKPEVKANSIRLKCQIISLKSNDSLIPIQQEMLLYLKPDVLIDSWDYGDLISMNAMIQIMDTPNYSYEFDYKKWLNRNHIYSTAFVSKAVKVGHETSFWLSLRYIPSLLRDYFEHEIEQFVLEPQSLKIAKSLLIGVRSDFDKELLDAYSNTGTIHILSVSGLHFGVLIGFLGWILKHLFPKQERLNFFLKQLLSFSYALITGFSPPVFRSFLMFFFLDVQKITKTKTSTYNLLFLSACIILLIDTTQLFDIGFILSYAALLGIVIFYNKFLWKIEFQSRLMTLIWESTCVMTAAWIFTTPFALYYFHKMTLLGMLSNYFVLPIAMVVMYLGFILMAFSKIHFIAVIIGNILSFLIYLQNQIIFYFEKIPFASIQPLYISSLELTILLCSIGLFTLFLFIKDKNTFRGFLFSIILFLGVKLYNYHGTINSKEWIDFKTTPFSTVGYREGRNLLVFTDSVAPKSSSFNIEPYMLSHSVDTMRVVTLNTVTPNLHMKISSNELNAPQWYLLCKENKFSWNEVITKRDSFIMSRNLGTYYSKTIDSQLRTLNKVYQK